MPLICIQDLIQHVIFRLTEKAPISSFHFAVRNTTKILCVLILFRDTKEKVTISVFFFIITLLTTRIRIERQTFDLLLEQTGAKEKEEKLL